MLDQALRIDVVTSVSAASSGRSNRILSFAVLTWGATGGNVAWGTTLASGTQETGQAAADRVQQACASHGRGTRVCRAMKQGR